MGAAQSKNNFNAISPDINGILTMYYSLGNFDQSQYSSTIIYKIKSLQNSRINHFQGDKSNANDNPRINSVNKNKSNEVLISHLPLIIEYSKQKINGKQKYQLQKINQQIGKYKNQFSYLIHPLSFRATLQKCQNSPLVKNQALKAQPIQNKICKCTYNEDLYENCCENNSLQEQKQKYLNNHHFQLQLLYQHLAFIFTANKLKKNKSLEQLNLNANKNQERYNFVTHQNDLFFLLNQGIKAYKEVFQKFNHEGNNFSLFSHQFSLVINFKAQVKIIIQSQQYLINLQKAGHNSEAVPFLNKFQKSRKIKGGLQETKQGRMILILLELLMKYTLQKYTKFNQFCLKIKSMFQNQLECLMFDTIKQMIKCFETLIFQGKISIKSKVKEYLLKNNKLFKLNQQETERLFPKDKYCQTNVFIQNSNQMHSRPNHRFISHNQNNISDFNNTQNTTFQRGNSLVESSSNILISEAEYDEKRRKMSLKKRYCQSQPKYINYDAKNNPIEKQNNQHFMKQSLERQVDIDKRNRKFSFRHQSQSRKNSPQSSYCYQNKSFIYQNVLNSQKRTEYQAPLRCSSPYHSSVNMNKTSQAIFNSNKDATLSKNTSIDKLKQNQMLSSDHKLNPVSNYQYASQKSKNQMSFSSHNPITISSFQLYASAPRNYPQSLSSPSIINKPILIKKNQACNKLIQQRLWSDKNQAINDKIVSMKRQELKHKKVTIGMINNKLYPNQISSFQIGINDKRVQNKTQHLQQVKQANATQNLKNKTNSKSIENVIKKKTQYCENAKTIQKQDYFKQIPILNLHSPYLSEIKQQQSVTTSQFSSAQSKMAQFKIANMPIIKNQQSQKVSVLQQIKKQSIKQVNQQENLQANNLSQQQYKFEKFNSSIQQAESVLIPIDELKPYQRIRRLKQSINDPKLKDKKLEYQFVLRKPSCQSLSQKQQSSKKQKSQSSFTKFDKQVKYTRFSDSLTKKIRQSTMSQNDKKTQQFNSKISSLKKSIDYAQQDDSLVQSSKLNQQNKRNKQPEQKKLSKSIYEQNQIMLTPSKKYGSIQTEKQLKQMQQPLDYNQHQNQIYLVTPPDYKNLQFQNNRESNQSQQQQRSLSTGNFMMAQFKMLLGKVTPVGQFDEEQQSQDKSENNRSQQQQNTINSSTSGFNSSTSGFNVGNSLNSLNNFHQQINQPIMINIDQQEQYQIQQPRNIIINNIVNINLNTNNHQYSIIYEEAHQYQNSEYEEKSESYINQQFQQFQDDSLKQHQSNQQSQSK